MFKYKRILLKLSGEALAGDKEFGFSNEVLESFAKQIKDVHEKGVQIAIVIGGGNIFRGISGMEKGFDRVTGDTMGMLATVMNGLALQNSIESLYIRRKAIRHLEKGRVVIFAGGTSNPYFTTDSSGALRAVEIQADVLAKGTKVDGIYDKDPMKFSDAVRYDTVTFDEAISKNLGVMDTAALSLCRENQMPIVVFNALEEGNILKMAQGEDIGTTVKK